MNPKSSLTNQPSLVRKLPNGEKPTLENEVGFLLRMTSEHDLWSSHTLAHEYTFTDNVPLNLE